MLPQSSKEARRLNGAGKLLIISTTTVTFFFKETPAVPTAWQPVGDLSPGSFQGAVSGGFGSLTFHLGITVLGSRPSLYLPVS